MKISDALAEASYVVDAEGKKTAVVIPVDIWEKMLVDWERLIDFLEDSEDVQIAQKAFAALDAAGGDRKKAGWLAWKDVEKDPA